MLAAAHEGFRGRLQVFPSLVIADMQELFLWRDDYRLKVVHDGSLFETASERSTRLNGKCWTVLRRLETTRETNWEAVGAMACTATTESVSGASHGPHGSQRHEVASYQP